MSLISKRTIDAVHDLSIVDVLKSYNVELKRSGSGFMSRCPFHNERTPSFSVSTRLNYCKCFSCGKGGGPVQFVMEKDGLEYREAIEQLAKDHNIVLEYERDERTDEDRAKEKKLESMRIAINLVQEFFVEQFKADNEEAEAARQYAYSRWGEDFCNELGVGYAPKDSRILLDYIKKRQLSLDLLNEIGITGTNQEKGDSYSMFRQRVTLPVRSRSRMLVGYSARYIGTKPDTLKSRKYMNLKDSILFDKSNTLFGIDVAGREARAVNNFVVVEGGPDVLRLQIIGVLQAVAPMGTALTTKHLEQMKRICSSVIFIPDSDAPKGKTYGAGVEAVMKNGKLALEQGFDVSVKEIPRKPEDDEKEVKYDADSYILSKEIYNGLKTVSFVEWYADKRLGDNPAPELKSEVLNEVAQLLLHVTDSLLREMYIDRLSKKFGKKKMLENAIKRAGRRLKDERNIRLDSEGIPKEITDSMKRVGLIPKEGCYYVIDDDGDLQRVSNFIFLPVLHIKNSKRSTRILKAVNSSGETDVIEFTSNDLVTARDINKKLFDRSRCVWLGDNKALMPLQEHLLEITPSANLVEILGYNPQNEFYAFSNGIYANGVFHKADKLGVVDMGKSHFFLPAFSEIHSDDELGYSFERLFKCKPQGMTSLRDFAAQIEKVYGNGGIVSFAWMLAAVFRDIIFAQFKYFPVLNLFGRKGSGKTELARAISSLFYTLPSTPSSCSNTSIPVIGYNLSHVRNSVIILDEFTNDLMPQRIDLIKGLWGGTARSKMEDGVPITIPVTSGVIMAGQYRPEDEAIFSRCIHLMYAQTTFSREEKQNFKELSEMVLHGNTHLLLHLLELRDIFEKGFFPAFDLTLSDVLNKLEKDKVEDRILNNWVVALAAFRVLEPHIDVPFTFSQLFDIFVDGIRYQNDQIRKSSDTANFWQYLDSMHTQGKVKENCHFVIKRLSSFTPSKKEKEKREFVEPKNIIFLNFKAVRVILEQRIARQKYGSTLDIATIESYLKSLPQYLGIKQHRFQILRTNGELDQEYKNDGTQSRKYVTSNPANALCFDYDSLKAMLDLNLETMLISEAEFNADATGDEPKGTQPPIYKEPELPF